MGRNDPIYSQTSKTLLVGLVLDEGMSIKDAVEAIERSESERINYETAKKVIQNARAKRKKVPATDEGRISAAASDLISYAEGRIRALKGSTDPKDLETAGKVAKLLLDLSKIAKERAEPPESDKPKSELEGLVG